MIRSRLAFFVGNGFHLLRAKPDCSLFAAKLSRGRDSAPVYERSDLLALVLRPERTINAAAIRPAPRIANMLGSGTWNS